MERFFIILATIILCIWIINYLTRGVKSSGVKVEQSRNIKGFTKVTTSASVDVYLKQGEEFAVVVEADKNIIDNVRTELKGDCLHVGYKCFINSFKWIFISFKGVKTKVFVTLPVVESLNSQSSGNIYVESNIEADNLKLKASSSGDIEFTDIVCQNLDIRASSSGNVKGNEINCIEDLHIRASSSGDIEFTDIICRNLDIRASSSGDVEGEMAKCEKELTVRVSSSGEVKIRAITPYCNVKTSSSGEVKIKGQGDYCIASTSSSGGIKLNDFICREVEATALSGGNIHINVTEKLTAKASSGGNIYYTGNPKDIYSSDSSGGNVKQR